MLGAVTLVRMNKLTGSVAVSVGLATGWASEPVPGWTLTDANLTSVRYHAQVSPSDYLLQVSAYYFGDAG